MSRTRQSVTFLPIDAIREHGSNVRDSVGDVTEMAASIREHGILQPLIVTEHPTTAKAFLLLAGHRRRAAAIKAGLDRVPCIIRHDLGTDEREHVAIMLVENAQRRQLTPLERARAIGRLLESGMNQSEVARATGMHASSVNTYALLLELDDDAAEAVEAGDITAADATKAVRAARQARRDRDGTPTRGRPVILDPPHLTKRHPLAATARKACRHTTRPKVGYVACGQCWEHAIRTDERTQS
ncbi:ParB-like protein [Aeromicrobium marinum DSM 15272]|uniref:ParB-like protein n=1 Tax=Aeromicrobium marinum DSM 15272 TaxID=585531 RepID=E2S7S5_9ACTN|nr:ParB/RepB/Spo0J family partition protein [Aeromicrobium marinum]EFQ84741.1 ParB-like protein [Aeromicrobium marinum DSM 15272]